MSIVSVIQAIIGAILVFFFPGWLATIVFFKKKPHIEKLIYSVLISLSIAMVLGFILGILQIFNINTLSIAYIIIIIILAVTIMIRLK